MAQAAKRLVVEEDDTFISEPVAVRSGRVKDIHSHECLNFQCPASLNATPTLKVRRGWQGGYLWRHDGGKPRTDEEFKQAHVCPYCKQEERDRYTPASSGEWT